MRITGQLDKQAFLQQLSTDLEGGSVTLDQARQIRDTLAKLSPSEQRKVSLPLLEDLGLAKELRTQVVFQLLAMRVPDFEPAAASKNAAEAVRVLSEAKYEPKVDDDGAPKNARERDKMVATERFAREVQDGPKITQLAPAEELAGEESRYYGADPGPTRLHGALAGIKNPVAEVKDGEVVLRDQASGRSIQFHRDRDVGSFMIEGGDARVYSDSIDYASANLLRGMVNALLESSDRCDPNAKVALGGLEKDLSARMHQLRQVWAAEYKHVRETLSSLASMELDTTFDGRVGMVQDKVALDDVIESLGGLDAEAIARLSKLDDLQVEKDGWYPGRRLDVVGEGEDRRLVLFRDGDSFQICLGDGIGPEGMIRSNASPKELGIGPAKALLHILNQVMKKVEPPADPPLRAALQGQEVSWHYDMLAQLASQVQARIDSLSGFPAALEALDRLAPEIENAKTWDEKAAALQRIGSEPEIVRALGAAGDRAPLTGVGHGDDRGHYSLGLYATGKGLEIDGYFMGHRVCSFNSAGHMNVTQAGGPIGRGPAKLGGAWTPHTLTESVWGDVSIPDVIASLKGTLSRGV